MQRVFSPLTRPINYRLGLVLFLIGLTVRIIGAFSYGDGDLEHFKAWTVLIKNNGLLEMYSKSDAEIYSYAHEFNVSFFEAFKRNRTSVEFNGALGYWREKYVIMYPPISEVLLLGSGILHYELFENWSNTRWFNFTVNLPMVILSILIFLILYKISISKDQKGNLSFMPFFYWLNPIFILDSPFQGYNNTLIFLLSLLTFLSLKRNWFIISVFLATLIFWSKPQGILILPLIIFFSTFGSSSKMRGFGISVIVFVLSSGLILSWPLFGGYFQGYVYGSLSAVFALDTWSTILLTARSWNLWYVVSFCISDFKELNVPVEHFDAISILSAKHIGQILFIIGSGFFAFLYLRFRSNSMDRNVFLLLGCFFTYNTLMINVQFNQFIYIVPGLIYFYFRYTDLKKHSFFLISFYSLQLFYYGGLGRDFGTPIGLIYYLNVVKMFNLFLVLLTLVSFFIWFQYFKRLNNLISSNL
jgi:hypothetical protein